MKSSLAVPLKVKRIWKTAINAQKAAYAPYSRFKVGAAFACGSKIFSGCNIENASYGAVVCAERVALWKAISEGCFKNIDDMVVVSHTPQGVGPCGLCLQVISEFCKPDSRIWIANTKKIYQRKLLRDLLPMQFSKVDLNRA